MKSREYWHNRFLQLEQSQNQLGIQCYEKIERQYRRAMRQLEAQINTWYGRLAQNNNVTMQDARRMLTGRELEEFKWDVKDYIHYGEENALSGEWMKQLENASARYHISRMEALKVQMQQNLEVMFGNQIDTIDTAMRDIYINGYYHTAYEIQKGAGVGWNFATLDNRSISKVINCPWAADGKNFSERIWQNRQKLVNELHTQLSQNIILGQDPQKAIDAIAHKMNTSKINAGRLIMTEKAFFSSVAQKDCFKELGVEMFEVVATLDSHTSDICQEMDGKVFPMTQWEVGVTAPPFHVFCRSTTVPAFGDEFDSIGERVARDQDGKINHIPTSMTYPEWEKAMVANDKSSLKNVQTNGKMEIQKTTKEVIAEKQAKIDALKVEYASLNEINTRFHMLSSDFSTLEEKQEWIEWKQGFMKNDSIDRIQGRMSEINAELTEAKGELAEARIQLLKSGSIDFVPSASIKEANSYAINALGINAEYKGLDIRSVNEWNQGLTNMKEVFPDLVNEKFGFVGESHERNAIAKQIEYNRQLEFIRSHNVYGWSDEKCQEWASKKAAAFVRSRLSVSSHEMASSWSPSSPFDACRGICMNRGYFGNYDKALENGIKQVERKWHPNGCLTVKATFDHEFGHQLDNWLGVSRQKNIQALFDSRSRSELTDELSEYAWNNHNSNRYSEMIAEAWSEYCNNPTPRPIAVEVGKTIERLYVEWAKKNL